MIGRIMSREPCPTPPESRGRLIPFPFGIFSGGVALFVLQTV